MAARKSQIPNPNPIHRRQLPSSKALWRVRKALWHKKSSKLINPKVASLGLNCLNCGRRLVLGSGILNHAWSRPTSSQGSTELKGHARKATKIVQTSEKLATGRQFSIV